MSNEKKVSLLDRLLEHLPDRPKDGCWEWKGHKENHGYGRMRYKGKRYRVHRAMMLVIHGELPQGKVVMHLCHNKSCCNPKHLKIGTQRENIIMDFERGAKSAKGASNPNSKLTAKQVREIKKLRSAGYGLSVIAKRYSVTFSLISQIDKGRIWAHIEI